MRLRAVVAVLISAGGAWIGFANGLGGDCREAAGVFSLDLQPANPTARTRTKTKPHGGIRTHAKLQNFFVSSHRFPLMMVSDFRDIVQVGLIIG